MPSPDTSDLFVDTELGYRLFTTSENMLCVSVLCGGIGVYEEIHELSEDELKRYAIEGKPYLDRLVRRLGVGMD